MNEGEKALDCRVQCMLDERCPSYRTCLARSADVEPERKPAESLQRA